MLGESIPDNEVTIFIIHRGVTCLVERIEEHFGGFFKGHAMFLNVGFGFVLVPFKENACSWYVTSIDNRLLGKAFVMIIIERSEHHGRYAPQSGETSVL
jgi:hypothetical protein